MRSLADDASVSVRAMSGSLADSMDEQSAQLRLRAQRGALDALALQHAYHDASLHRQLAPDDALERALFDVFEQERYESIGCNAFAGVQLNLDARDLRDAYTAEVPSDEPGRSAQATPIGRLRVAVHALCRRGLRQRADNTSLHPAGSSAVDEQHGVRIFVVSIFAATGQRTECALGRSTRFWAHGARSC